MSHFGIPGIGGSLGQCAVCGEAFAFEIITGKSVESFTMSQFKDMMYCHDKCGDIVKAIIKNKGVWQDLPDGPIRQAFTKLAGEDEAA